MFERCARSRELMSFAFDEAAEQAAANQSAIPYHAEFQGHRERLTALACAAAATTSEKTLCVLGAGNVYDLDLRELARHFDQIHLVDLDANAVRAAAARQDEATRARLAWHAPLDLSDMHDRLERWASAQLTPDELISHAGRTARTIRGALGRRFGVVVSACVLSQMQLSLLRAVGADHHLFAALRVTLNAAHLRTLAELTAPGGRAWFVTDVSSDRIARFGATEPGGPAIELVNRLSHAGDVFAFADPRALRLLYQDDPHLCRMAELSAIQDAWIWDNGPDNRFVVYAVELARGRAETAG
jgi:hypothetical protein